MSEQCPIGMDHDPDACMAGVCRRCRAREARKAFWQGFRSIVFAEWLLWVAVFCVGAFLTWISLP